MPKRETYSEGSSIDGHWNDLSPFERLQMLLEHADQFLELGVITRDDLESVLKCSVSEWDYVIGRQDQPLFKTINLKSDIAEQAEYREKLKAALSAVFL